MGNSNENYSITISGDTIIQSQTYHKLIIPFVKSNNSGVCDFTTIGYKGAFRQDKINKKVFFIPPTENTEQLLYDFTLQVGDTVKGFLNLNLDQPDTIKSIDSVLVGNIYRKRWNTNSCYKINLIEGIGSTYGLIIPSPGCRTDFPDYSIICFQQYKISIYPETAINCDLINSVKPIETNSTQIKIYSNKQSGSFTITFDNADIVEIKLIDLSGKVIFVRSTKNEKTIIISNLQSGLYILTGKDRTNRLITKKLIRYP